MNKHKNKITWFALIALAGIAVWLVLQQQWFLRKTSWHQRYEIVVSTPNGDISGSSVMQMNYAFVPDWRRAAHLSGNSHAFGWRGEAVAVDLGEGRYLFALTVREGTQYVPFHTFGPILNIQKNDYQTLAPKIAGYKGKVDIPPSSWPLLVTFTDINDPKTVKQVNPDDLAATFGEGHTLKNITLEITSEPVTKGVVEGVLGWIVKAEFIIPTKLRPSFSDRKVLLSLRPSHFIDGKTLKEIREGAN